MARPLIRRRITVTGNQRADIDADLLTQALLQIAEDEATPTDGAAPTPRRSRRNRPAEQAKPKTTSVSPSRNRPASRGTRDTRPPSPTAKAARRAGSRRAQQP